MNVIVPIPLYKVDVMFSFGQSDKEMRMALKQYGVRTTDHFHKLAKNMAGVTVNYDNGFTLIRMWAIPKAPEDFGVLQHEIFHAVVYVMEYAGATLNDSSNEAYAYLVEHLTTEIMKALLPKESVI